MAKIASTRVPPILGLVLAPLLLAPGLRAGEEAASPSSSLQVFESLYARIEAAGAEGRLPAGTAEAASGLAFDLERELLLRDAEIEVLRLEVVRFDGERQQQALDRLIAAAAAREQRVIEQIRRLEGIAGMSAGALPAAGVLAESAAPPSPVDGNGTVAEPAGDDEPQGEGSKLKVIFEPEDPIEDPDP